MLWGSGAGQGLGHAVLDEVVGIGFVEWVTLEQRLDRAKRVSLVTLWGRSVWLAGTGIIEALGWSTPVVIQLRRRVWTGGAAVYRAT